jgi:1,4-alpha-glucan branching enzyme
MVMQCSLRAKTMEFKLYAPAAKRVSLAGNFNNWNTRRLAAKKDSKGNWLVKLNLKPGMYEYKFFVDGSWINDPNSSCNISNTFGTQNNVIEIK